YLRQDSNEESVIVCGAAGSAKSRLVDGLPSYPLPMIYGDNLLCYRDYNGSRQVGNLTLYNGKVKPVARYAYDYSYRLQNYIYVIKDYDTGIEMGDLYLYSGNSEKLTLIDTGVSAIMK
ncbi:MAG: hypothetical protein RSF82_09545, partial [Angelakisella sp.]